jgi:hypothetical protein
MRQFLRALVALATSVVVASCGGGGSDAGDPPFGGGGGGGGGGTTTAADLSLTLSSTSISNTGSDVVTVTATAVDASRVALAGVPVVIGVDNNAIVVVGSSTTDSSGSVTATVNLGTDRSNRLVTVTATSGSLTRSAAFQVIGAKLAATLSPAVVAPGASAQVQYRLTDANDNPMSGQALSVSGDNLTGAEGTTGSNGEYVFSYTAPSSAGNLNITAQAGGVTSVQTVLVQSGANTIPAATGTVQSASVTANPSVVAVNTDSTSNRAEIRALFVGTDPAKPGQTNAPIERVRVRFDLNGDSNSIGGAMSTGSNIVYSNANGVAVSAYAPGSRSSPTDGVTVRACWALTDFPAGTCPNQSLVTLTVTSEALAVTIGTNNLIESGSGDLTFIKKYVVLVVDASGQAKADVQLSPSIDLVAYVKGSYPSGPGAWVQVQTATCLNEDINRNGVLEANENDGQDTLNSSGVPVPDNANGALEPRKSDVAITMVGGNRTNSSGIAILQIEYPKNVATWVDFLITVAASGIAGTEGRDTWAGRLPAAAADFEAEIPPPFVRSPYGVASSCLNPN